MTHPVMWFEVLGADGGKLRKFYGDLFGWTFDVPPRSTTASPRRVTIAASWAASGRPTRE